MFKKSYVVSAESWNDMLKNKKQKKTQVAPPQVSHIEPPLLASGLTAASRLNRFRKNQSKKKQKLGPPPSAGRIDSYFLPDDTRDILLQLPLDNRQQAMYLLNFVSKKIPPSIFTWDRTTLELVFRQDVLPESNFADVIKYLFGVGDAWLTSYTKPEIGGVPLVPIRSIPRGASHFYFTLEHYQETPTTVFGFHPPFVLNLARFHFSVLEPTMSMDEQKQAKKDFTEKLQTETTHLDLQKFYQHNLWSRPTKTPVGSLPARFPRHLDIVIPPTTPKSVAPASSSSSDVVEVVTPLKPVETKKQPLLEWSPVPEKPVVTKKRLTILERNLAKALREEKKQKKLAVAKEERRKKKKEDETKKKSWNDELGGDIIGVSTKRDRRQPDRYSSAVFN